MMDSARIARALGMQSPATWTSGPGATSVLSTSKVNKSLPADGQLLGGRILNLSRLMPWSSHRLPRHGNWMRVCGMGGDGDTTGTPPSQDSQISNLQSQLSSKSVVEGDEEARNVEDALDVFSNFIDEQLLYIIHNPNVETPVRQTVLITDGTDTRPYRLIWPSPSVIFCASPEPAFIATSIKQIEKGLKVPRSWLLQHLSVDLVNEDWGDDFIDNLVRKGYRGDTPSAWVIEMLRAELSEVSLQAIFTLASSLLMKGSTFLGVLSCPWMGTSELETRASLRRLCAGHGFTVELLSYEKLTSNSHNGVEFALPPNRPFAFIAQQQRLSDAQVEYARNQIEMAEEVDEDGFEDAW